MDQFIAIALTVITAATPLLIAAIGELVVERSGVLNLGVEGMMVMGAVCGFGAALITGNPYVGVLAAIAAGAAMAFLFGVLTLHLRVEPGGDRLGAHASRPRTLRPDR